MLSYCIFCGLSESRARDLKVIRVYHDSDWFCSGHLNVPISLRMRDYRGKNRKHYKGDDLNIGFKDIASYYQAIPAQNQLMTGINGMDIQEVKETQNENQTKES